MSGNGEGGWGVEGICLKCMRVFIRVFLEMGVGGGIDYLYLSYCITFFSFFLFLFSPALQYHCYHARTLG